MCEIVIACECSCGSNKNFVVDYSKCFPIKSDSFWDYLKIENAFLSSLIPFGEVVFRKR
jgi:hypothetical protein